MIKMMKNSILTILLLVALTGCLGGPRPAAVVTFYSLEYASPTLTDPAPCPQSLRVERFSANRAFEGRGMVYRPSAFVLAEYSVARWWVAPADLITDALVRDLRNSGCFPAVSTSRDADDARFVLAGNVEECVELREKDGAQAVLAIRITCRDVGGVPMDRIVLDKTYAVREPLRDSGPGGLAGAMSRAAARLSQQLLTDVCQTLRQAT
jgi:ABC-type uncharacterized transport system auxiliary subunit